MRLIRLARFIILVAVRAGILFVLVHDFLVLPQVESSRVGPTGACRKSVALQALLVELLSKQTNATVSMRIQHAAHL